MRTWMLFYPKARWAITNWLGSG